jgi:hypothetical protein
VLLSLTVTRYFYFRQSGVLKRLSALVVSPEVTLALKTLVHCHLLCFLLTADF